MGWITLAEAQAGAQTTDLSTEAAELIAAWLGARHDEVMVSAEMSDELLYGQHGISLRQRVSVVRREYRGLAADLAVFLADYLPKDNTAVRTWCAVWNATYANSTYSNIEFDTCAVTGGPDGGANTVTYHPTGKQSPAIAVATTGLSTGLRRTATASRANDADGYVVVTETYVYDAPYSPDAYPRFCPKSYPVKGSGDSLATGVVVSKSNNRQFVFSYSNSPLYVTEATEVVEYRNLTQTQAMDYVSQATAATYRLAQHRASATGVSNYTTVVKIGTEKTADARYIDAERGWTATITQITRTANFVTSGAGWYNGGNA